MTTDYLHEKSISGVFVSYFSTNLFTRERESTMCRFCFLPSFIPLAFKKKLSRCEQWLQRNYSFIRSIETVFSLLSLNAFSFFFVFIQSFLMAGRVCTCVGATRVTTFFSFFPDILINPSQRLIIHFQQRPVLNTDISMIPLPDTTQTEVTYSI